MFYEVMYYLPNEAGDTLQLQFGKTPIIPRAGERVSFLYNLQGEKLEIYGTVRMVEYLVTNEKMKAIIYFEKKEEPRYGESEEDSNAASKV